MRAAGCRGVRKVCGRALEKMRRLAEKEAGVFGRDAWAGMSRAAEEAGGATGCGGSRAWGRAGLALAEAGVQRGDESSQSRSHAMEVIGGPSFGYFDLVGVVS